MYHTGTINEFNTWHDAVKTMEGITSVGKQGYILDEPASDAQRTTAYSAAVKHPTDDIYVWVYGAHPIDEKSKLTISEVNSLGWEFN